MALYTKQILLTLLFFSVYPSIAQNETNFINQFKKLTNDYSAHLKATNQNVFLEVKHSILSIKETITKGRIYKFNNEQILITTNALLNLYDSSKTSIVNELYLENLLANFSSNFDDATSNFVSENKSSFQKIAAIYNLSEIEKEIINKDRKAETAKEIHSLRTQVLSKVISKTINMWEAEIYQDYRYFTSKRNFIKFFSINHSNDLFGFVTGNNDMAYTGAFRIELGTDYLRFSKSNKYLTYSTFGYGLDVHTPYFQDSTIFGTKANPISDTFNRNDRPHGNFSYAMTTINSLSNNGNYKFQTNVKLGIIGGSMGKNFQELLHRDISQSNPTAGWGRQIASSKRLGIQIENNVERAIASLSILPDFKMFNNINLDASMHFSVFGHGNIGTYQTNYLVGLKVSNRPMRTYNHHNVSNFNLLYNNFIHRFLVYGTIAYKKNIHNSMLEGYGLYKRDRYSFQTDSVFINKTNIINHIIETKATISYNTPYLTLYYSLSANSPDAKFDKTKYPLNPRNGKPINLNTWFVYGTFGLVFKGI